VATDELHGYSTGNAEEIPDYRKVYGAIMVDGRNMVAQIRDQQISRFDFPEDIREHITERVTLGHGVGELEAMRKKATDGGVRLALPGSAELGKIMNYQAQQAGYDFQTIERVFWSVSEPALAGVLDAIRTTLVSLVAEMRAGMPEDANIPSAAVADQAVNVAVYGGQNRIEITSAHASGNGSHQVHSTSRSSSGSKATFWVVLGSITGVAALVVGIAAWQGWGVG
jgi:hypothetical protein